MENFYKLRDWVPNKITDMSEYHRYGRWLCNNTSPGIIKYLRETPSLIHGHERDISKNPTAIEFLIDPKNKRVTSSHADFIWNKHPDVVPYILNMSNTKFHNQRTYNHALSCNPSPVVIAYLRENPENIVWDYLCQNTSPLAIEMLRENRNKINVFCLGLNGSSDAMKLLEEIYLEWRALARTEEQGPAIVTDDEDENNPVVMVEEQSYEKYISRLDDNDWEYIWREACRHPAGLKIVLKYNILLDLDTLCANPAPEAIEILSEYMFDNLNWIAISRNPGAIDLLEQVFAQNYNEEGIYIGKEDSYDDNDNLQRNPRIYWSQLLQNPAIFTYDYDLMHSTRQALHKDLIEYYWSPRRIAAYLAKNGDIEDGDIDELEENL